MTILPQLRDGLVRARPRRARRPFLVGLFAAGGLVATTGALAATGVLQLPPVGDPVEPKHVERDPERGVGVPTDQAGRLLALRVPDPAGGPPWGLRVVETTRGMLCLQAGRVVGEQLGLLGQDGIGADDGRFHPLPTATASGHVTPCQRPDGDGRFFIGVDKHSYASGDATVRACREPGERSKEPRCPTADARRIAFGLLGPEAMRVTFRDGSTQVPTEGDGAYLFVTDQTGGETVSAYGGGPIAAIPWSGVRRVDYRDGTHCPTADQRTMGCLPKGYVEPEVEASGSLRRKLTVKTSRREKFTWVRVRFRAPAPITDANREYRLEGRFPQSELVRCRRVVMHVPSQRNLRRGDTVTLEGIVPNDCAGRLVATVKLVATEQRDGGKLVGRFSRPLAGGPNGPR